MTADEYLTQTWKESASVQEDFIRKNGERVVLAAKKMGECIRKGGKILIFGNGGSAADAQHMAAEMVGRMLVKRRPLPAIALTADTSNLTAISNDFGYDQVFRMQIQALARPGDIVVAISTSGNSPNVISAVKMAREMGCTILSLTGSSGGQLKNLSDLCLNAEAGKNSCRIQEAHHFAIHSMVDLLDRFFLEENSSLVQPS